MESWIHPCTVAIHPGRGGDSKSNQKQRRKMKVYAKKSNFKILKNQILKYQNTLKYYSLKYMYKYVSIIYFGSDDQLAIQAL